MRNLKSIVITALAAMSTGIVVAYAGEPQFGFTKEFLKVCAADQSSFAAGQQSFTGNNWTQPNAEMTEALSPAFFLTEVHQYAAYEIALTNGGAWYGTYSRGKLAEFNVHMCNLWLITDSIAGVRDDMAQAIGRSNPQLVNASGENRYIYTDGDNENIYFAQEGQEEDGITTMVLAKVYEGN